MASTNFINECKNRANANRLGKIIIDNQSKEITNHDNLKQFSIDDGCYIDGNIIGSVYVRKLVGEFIAVPEDIELLDQTIQVQIGVKYSDNSNEYINMGKYTIERPKDEQTANMSQIIAYSNIYYGLDEKYVCNIDFSNDDITVKDFYLDVCNQLNVTPKTISFLNDNIPVKGNPFTNGETRRYVLKRISQVGCSYVTVDLETDEIELSWLSQNINPDYEFIASDYTTLEGGKIVYGPVNSVVIKDSQIEGENATRDDKQSITDNGETQITIEDNEFLYTEELRWQAIDAIWDRLKGLTYTDCKLTTSYGKPFLPLGAKIRINTNDGRTFDSYNLKHNFTYSGEFTSIIESPALTKQETKIKNKQELKDRVRRTEQITDKINGQIIEVIEEQSEQQSKISQVTQNIDNIQNLFQITGGSNDIHNSQGMFDWNFWQCSENGTFIGGSDDSLIGKTVSNAKIGISNGTLKTTNDNITGLLLSEIRNLSFKVSNDDNTTLTIKLIGNSTLVEEIIDYKCQFKEFSYQYIPDTPNLTLEITSTTIMSGYSYIYDLMSNSGDKKNWESARDEISGTVLELSKLGLKIYGTSTDIATLLTSQGFQIRRFQNGNLYEVITEFTSEGMITKKAIMEYLEIDKLVTESLNVNMRKHYIRYIRS